MKSKDVIFDTNLWISFLIRRDLRFIDSLIEKGKIKLIFSEELLQEFLTVSRRPKFRNYFSANDIEDLLRVFDMYGRFVKVSTSINDCRDIKDNFFTFTLVRGKEKVLGEVGLMFIGYNLSRCISILGMANLIKALRNSCLPTLLRQIRFILSPYNDFRFSGLKFIPGI